MTTFSETQIAGRALRFFDALSDQERRKLSRQLWRSGISWVASLIIALALLLFIVYGPEFGQRASMFVSFLLVMSVGTFVAALFSFLTPLFDAIGFHKINSDQKEIEKYDLQEQIGYLEGQNEKLRDYLREAVEADDPGQFVQENRGLIVKVLSTVVVPEEESIGTS